MSEKKRTLEVYTGVSVKDRTTNTHPVISVQIAKRKMDQVATSKKTRYRIRTNRPELVSAIHALIPTYPTIEVEFFLDGVAQGKEIANIFTDFNRAYDLIDNINPQNPDNK